VCARAISGALRPVSSASRKTKLVPAWSTTLFVTQVATIWRRSGGRRSARRNGRAGRREVPLELVAEVRVLRNVGGEQLLEQLDLV